MEYHFHIPRIEKLTFYITFNTYCLCFPLGKMRNFNIKITVSQKTFCSSSFLHFY